MSRSALCAGQRAGFARIEQPLRSVTVDFWFDYSCPLSLVTRSLLDEVARDSGAEIRSHPFERREGGPPDDALPAQQMWRHGVLPLAARMGVPIDASLPVAVPDTRLAYQGYQYACDHGRGDAYNDQVFAAHFRRRLDIGRLPTLVGLAGRAGLDTQEFRLAAASRHYAGRHRAAVRQARERVALTPTVIVGDRRIEGVPGREQLLRLVVEATAGSGRKGTGA